MDACLLEDVLLSLPEIIRRDTRHQPGLVIDRFSEVFLGNVPGGDHLQGVANVVIKVHGVFSCG